jgi:riboflavin kinase/FMN adenylyltransferase
MDVIDRPRWELDAPSVLTVGVFDGLHRGHQALIARVVSLASQHHLCAGVVTFSDHPLAVLAPPFAPKKLLYPDRKLQLLRRSGLNFTVVQKFTREFSRLTPTEFVEEMLVKRARMKAIVCGEDFCFGAQGKGTVATLRELSAKYGFEVDVLPPVLHGETFVRSTMIRDLLYTGDVAAAAELLSRPHELRGLVVRGQGRGRTLGFPTANLEVNPAYAMPARGVYVCAGYLPADEMLVPALVNIGFNPTFGSERLTIEAHLVDFAGELVGADLYLFFLHRLRDEMLFPSPDALVAQIQRDRAAGLEYYDSPAARHHRETVLSLVSETRSINC